VQRRWRAPSDAALKLQLATPLGEHKLGRVDTHKRCWVLVFDC
jgi:hypothetical protein